MTAQFDLLVLGRGAAAGAFLHALARERYRGAVGLVGLPHSPAFDGARAEHLLNTPSAVMSIDPARPNDFCDYLQKIGADPLPQSFARRRQFGAYLRAREAQAIQQLRIQTIGALARSLDYTPQGWRVVMDAGPTLHAKTLVCALGYGPARPLIHPDAHTPWSDVYDMAPFPQSRIGIVGSGLSGLDALQSALIAGARHIAVFSGSGAFPHPHLETPATPLNIALDSPSPARLLRALRVAAKSHPWRDILQGVRADTERVWAQFTPTMRKRLLASRAMDFWSRHRHRAPQQAYASLTEGLQSGTVRIRRAAITSIMRHGDALNLLANEGSPQAVVHTCDVIIDARGPSLDGAQAPIWTPLLEKGIVTRSLAGAGLTATSALALGQRGDAVIFGIGAIHIGEKLETTAFPELRAQANAIVETIMRSAPV